MSLQRSHLEIDQTAILALEQLHRCLSRSERTTVPHVPWFGNTSHQGAGTDAAACRYPLDEASGELRGGVQPEIGGGVGMHSVFYIVGVVVVVLARLRSEIKDL